MTVLFFPILLVGNESVLEPFLLVALRRKNLILSHPLSQFGATEKMMKGQDDMLMKKDKKSSPNTLVHFNSRKNLFAYSLRSVTQRTFPTIKAHRVWGYEDK